MKHFQTLAFKHLLLQHRQRMSRAQRQRPVRLTPPPFPIAIERQMAKDIKRLVFHPIIAKLWNLLTEQSYNRLIEDYNRHDRQDGRVRQDVYESEINRIIGTLRTSIEGLTDEDSPIAGALKKTIIGEYFYSKGQWEKQTEKVVGTPWSSDEPWWEKTRKAWLDENITLIKSQPEEVIKRISTQIYSGVRNSWTWGDLKAQLLDTTGFTVDKSGNIKETNKGLSAKAELIARDQIGKLNGQLSKYRQTEIGLNYYVWTTVHDERVREAHKEMDGGLCDWNNPNVVSWDEGKTWIDRPVEMQGLIPGEDYQCRCQALAWFGDLLNEADNENQDQTNTDSGEGLPMSSYEPLLSPKQRVDAIRTRKAFRQDKTTKKEQPKPSFNDTELDNKILLEAVQAIIQTVKINTSFDVPYLAGYSKNGKIVYIDQHLPQTLDWNGARYNIYPFIILHEVIEYWLETTFKLSYQSAHQIALRLEREAVEASGLDWVAYDAFCNQWIKFAGHEQLIKIPRDLDVQPYKDENDRAAILAMMRVSKDHSDSNKEGGWVTINGQHVLLGKGGEVKAGNPKVLGKSPNKTSGKKSEEEKPSKKSNSEPSSTTKKEGSSSGTTVATKEAVQSIAKEYKMGVPKKIEVDGKNSYFQDHPHSIAFYDLGSDRILLNGGKVNPKVIQEQYRLGQFSTGSENHIILHELSHRELYAKYDLIDSKVDNKYVKRFNELNKFHRPLSKADKRTAELLVSKRAADNYHEFFAEVNTGLKVGKTYGEAVMSIYRKVGGEK